MRVNDDHQYDEDDEGADETSRLASVAFNSGASQFGCPQCGAIVYSARADERGMATCDNCSTEIHVPGAPPIAASEINQSLSPVHLPGRREENRQPSPINQDRSTMRRVQRDSDHRLNPDLKPKLQPIEEMRSEPEFGKNWAESESKYVGNTGIIRKLRALLKPLLIIAAIGGMLYLLFGLKLKSDTKEAGAKPRTELQAESAAAIKNLQEYEKFTEVKQRSLYVRHKEETLPRMNKYFSTRGITPPVPDPRPYTAKMVMIDGLEFLQFDSALRNKPMFIFFEKTETGDFLVDWESLVVYGDTDWNTYVYTEPADAQSFRLYAHWEDYYNHEFSDNTTHKCIALNHIESTEQIYAYVEIGSNVYEDAIKILDRDPKTNTPVRISIRFAVPGKQHRQVLVEDIANGWLQP
jgi:predicted RNA-binding Zn-ribbon protein involved in translation (DUF1610 family)